MTRRALLPLTLVLLVGALVILAVLLSQRDAQAPAEQTAAALGVPGGFQDRKVVDVPRATALAFAPGGRMLVSDREGRIRVHNEGASGTTEALDISNRVCSNSERGLLGLAVHPNFETNGFVYAYYTYNKSNACPDHQPERGDNPVNRVSRFMMSGDTIAEGSEEVLIDGIPSPNGNHNAGDLHFGKDGKLYVSVGDGACDYAEPRNCQAENDASRDKNILLGKILRINPDGSIPQDNPYAQSGNLCGPRGGDARTAPGNNCKETFASGLRNPFRMAFDPDASGTSFRINDVGWRYIEEVDQGKPGADYGWYCREGTRVNSNTGACDPAPNGMVKPIHQYGHSDGCSSITGSAFVPNQGSWPDSYDDTYLYGDYVCGKIFKLKPKGGGGFERTNFAAGLGQGGPVSMAFGPSGDDLYYTTFVGGGQVHRISYVAGNKAPTASAAVTNGDYGPQDKPFQFDGSGSTDPDSGDTLAYEWDFDYSAGSFTRDAGGIMATHTYSTPGPKKAALRVTDDRGASDVVEVPVYPGNTAPPEPVIGSPAPGKTFVVGEEIALSGSATDADDTSNPELKWEVIRHHTAPNTHTHPFREETGPNLLTFLAPAPEDLLSTNPAGNYLEVRLTAKDSQGLRKTVSRDLKPETTEVSFATGPTGFRLSANGETFKGPRTFLSWEGYGLNVYAPSQTRDGRDWIFRSWSDGRGARHTIVTPTEPETYTATFRRK